MTEGHPGFSHRPARHGLVGPFGGRQIVLVLVAVVGVAALLAAVTAPLGTTNPTEPAVPRATAYVIGAPTQGLRPGDLAPDFAVTRADGSTFQLDDLSGRPIRLADLRGRGVWVNFWATWCPPCQAETPVLRDVYDRYRDRGLALVAIAVQETSPDDVRIYGQRYGLTYTIGFDTSADVFRRWKIYALPTQFFIGPDGVIRSVVQGPLDEAGAVVHVQAILPAARPSP